MSRYPHEPHRVYLPLPLEKQIPGWTQAAVSLMTRPTGNSGYNVLQNVVDYLTWNGPHLPRWVHVNIKLRRTKGRTTHVGIFKWTFLLTWFLLFTDTNSSENGPSLRQNGSFCLESSPPVNHFLQKMQKLYRANCL
jgi:hypothetical protein